MIEEIVKSQREFFQTGKTKEISFRKQALEKVKKMIEKNQKEIELALQKDLNKSSSESYLTEIGLCLSEINFMLSHIKKWSKPKKVPTPLFLFPGKSYQISEPYGLALIISPWNYPFLLSIEPMIDAIAAGNTVIIKPSEYSPNTSNVIGKLIKQTFEEKFISVIQGEKEVCLSLLDKPFDTIFYTGSTKVGKIVMEKAAKQLIPVTLELGGKSPCIVDNTANLSLAAKRIVFGKLLNAGQTCVAPDYILVQKESKSKLLEEIHHFIKQFLGSQPLDNRQYAKIISAKHFERLVQLLQTETILMGGNYDTRTFKIEPTVIEGSTAKKELIEEEIFGPILPIWTFDTIEEAIKIVQSYEKPLALYLFSKNRNNQKKIIEKISFGGGCINATILHLASPHLAFGGVGKSGMGSYHGKAGFDSFTHSRSVLKKSNWFDLPIQYMPYTKAKDKSIRFFLK